MADKIKRLNVYLKLVKERILVTTGDKKLFFEREARKTQANIDKLTK